MENVKMCYYCRFGDYHYKEAKGTCINRESKNYLEACEQDKGCEDEELQMVQEQNRC